MRSENDDGKAAAAWSLIIKWKECLAAQLWEKEKKTVQTAFTAAQFKIARNRRLRCPIYET